MFASMGSHFRTGIAVLMKVMSALRRDGWKMRA
jgi:hypothetical protein